MSDIKFEQPMPVQLATITARLFANCQEKEIRHVAQHGISTVEFRCLQILFKNKTLNVNQLAQLMSLSASRITRIMDSLVAKKLVSRDISESDRRIFNLTLTSKGLQLGETLIQAYEKIHTEILTHVPPEDHHEMIKMLEKLNAAVEAWLNEHS